MTWAEQPNGATLAGATLAGAPAAGTPAAGEPTAGERPRDRTDELVSAGPAAGRRPVVLVATAQLQVRAIGTTVLGSAGFEVRTESRGETILAGLETRRPDLILTDLKLDDMDAARLCSEIRQTAAGQAVPILVISDFLHSPTIQEILSQDFTDLVSVPVNWKVLTFRINRWISMARKFRAIDDQELDFEQVRDSARKASTELLQLRNYDPITGLPNRELFLSMVELVMAQNQRSSAYAAVLFIDLDDFKGVNDLIGRALGDELLRIVAKRLQGSLREGDMVSQAGDEGSLTSFSRLNGDQFAILLSSVQTQEATTAVAERLLESLSRPLQIGERELRLTAKIGIAEVSELEEAGEEVILQRAETAMRYCKQRKAKTWAFFESFMNELVMKKLELKAELQQAVEQDQLFFCYQLLVDSQTAAPQGVEALVRWQHPKRGLIPPDEFLPVAEEGDLILEVDRWVLRHGCLQAKRWLDMGFPPLLMSLNVSMRFLEEKDFAEQVLQIVEETGLPPTSLQVELSERGTLPEAGRIMPQFELLVAKGIHLALDDFGTGQTSLSYLRTLPITCVKVDRSFVRRVPEDSASVAIVTAIAAMSHHLGLKVVAEGVETEEHWRFLADNGYDQLQGYLFAKPERIEVVEERWRNLDQPPRPLPPAPAAGAPTAAAEAPAAEPPVEIAAIEITPVEELLAGTRSAESGVAAAAAEPSAEITPVEITPVEELLAGAMPAAEPSAAAAEARPSPSPPPTSSRTPAAEPPSGSQGAAADAADGWQQSEGYLQQLARSDFLTKLYNRFSFDERLEHAVAHADRFEHKVALLLIDLDDFKYVNDTHGHAVGDDLLIAIATRLKSFVRKVDTLARIGGDEFAVILSEFHDLKQVAEFASRILSLLAQPVDVEGRELRVTGSLGIAVYPAPGTRVKDLLRQADLALYKVKNSGGNNVGFFAREMDREVQRDLALARELGGAVERGELYIEYQLQVALATGSIVGAEALVRWNHPSKGVIPPGRFIPIAESTGEIRAIGHWVIQSACAEARRWRSSSGRDVRVSVNLSPVQCRDSSFVATVLRTLREHDLAPELLDLEVNERLLKHLPKGMEASFGLLGELGVGLTLDNFGSGSSALEYFQRYRFDRLKIDQNLVRTISKGPMSASVLSGIVALARKMNVQIVAEGIEEPEELDRLVAEGCDQGQGFLFSRPLSADAILALMTPAGILPGFLPTAIEPPAEEVPAAEARSTAEVSSDEAPVDEAPSIAEAPADEAPSIAEAPADEDLADQAPEDEALSIDDSLSIEEALSILEIPVEIEERDGGELPRLEAAGKDGDAGSWPPSAAGPEEADADQDDLKRLSSFARSAAADRVRKRVRTALLLAALVVCSVYLLRDRFPDLAATVPQPTVPQPTAAAVEPVAEAVAETPAAVPPAEMAPAAVAPAAVPPPQVPPPTAPQSSATEAADPSPQLLEAVQRWAQAWSEQRVDDYLRCYSQGFRPPGEMSRGDWQALRRTRIARPARIGVRLSAIEVDPVSAERARVSFDQSYRTPSYSDVVRKTLELVREGGAWRILEERVDG